MRNEQPDLAVIKCGTTLDKFGEEALIAFFL